MIQISLHIYPVQSESSLCAFRIAKDAKFLDADNKDWSNCLDAQADLSLCGHTSEGTFSHVAVHICRQNHSDKSAYNYKLS